MAIDVTDADFQQKVLERSKEVPVVLDLWAPWCGPCRQLAPILENLEKERDGQFELVKINVDENPQVASALRAQSIPLVYGFRDGKAVAQFVGLQPPAAIRQFLDQLIPSELELTLAEAGRALNAGDTVVAEALIDKAEAIDAKHDAVRFSRASLLTVKEDYPAAIEILSGIPSNGHDEVARLLARARLNSGTDKSIEALAAEAAAGDITASIYYSKALASQGDYRRALETLLGAVKKDPSYDEGAARKAMLDLFEIMGSKDPLTREYRGLLSSALH